MKWLKNFFNYTDDGGRKGTGTIIEMNAFRFNTVMFTTTKRKLEQEIKKWDPTSIKFQSFFEKNP